MAGDGYLFGSGGAIVDRRSGQWRELKSDPGVDFVAAGSMHMLLAADGRLLGVRSVAEGGLETHARLGAGMMAVTVGPAGEDAEGDQTAIVVGADGRAARLGYAACELRR